MENFGKFMAIVLSIIVGPIIKGFVFSKLWLWFLAPTFQIQPLRVIEAIGIMLLLRFLTFKPNRKAKEGDFWEVYATYVVSTILISGSALLFGWIVTLFI